MKKCVILAGYMVLAAAAYGQFAANSIDWGYGRPGVRVVTNAPDHVGSTGIAAYVAGQIATPHMQSNDVHTTAQQKINWNAAYGWGNHALGGYLTSFIELDPAFCVWASTNQYVKVEQDFTALAALANYHPTILYDATTPGFLQTLEGGRGTIRGASSNAYYTVEILDDVLNSDGTPLYGNGVGEFPFAITDWEGTLEGDVATVRYTASAWGLWRGTITGDTTALLPVQGPSGETCSGTIYLYRSYIDTTPVYSLLATTAELGNIVTSVTELADSLVLFTQTNIATVLNAAQPSIATVYGDMIATNVAGYGRFVPVNPSASSKTLVRSNVLEENTAWFYYAITGLVTDAKTIAYATAGTGATRYGNARLWLFNDAGVVLASNNVALPASRHTEGAAAWFTNELSFASNPVTNGSLRLAVTLGNSIAQFGSMAVNSGSTAPLTLEVSTAPLKYVTHERFAKKLDAVGGLATDLRVTGSLDFNGIVYSNIPSQIIGVVTNGQSNVLLSNLTVNGGAVFSNDLTVADAIYQAGELVATTGHVAQASLADADGYTTQMVMRVGSEITTNRWGPRVTLPDGVLTNRWIGDTVTINNLKISKWPGGLDSRAFIDCQDYYGFAFQGSLVFYLSPIGASWPQNKMATFGGNEEAVLYFDGTDMIIDSARVGTGKTRIKRDAISEGSLTVAGTNTAAVLRSESGDLYLQGTNYGPTIANAITNGQVGPLIISNVGFSPNGSIWTPGTVYGYSVGGDYMTIGTSVVLDDAADELRVLDYATGQIPMAISVGQIKVGPSIGGKQAHIFTDGTNFCSVGVNGETNTFSPRSIIKPISASPTNVVISATNAVYYVALTNAANIGFDFSALSLANSIAKWDVAVDFTATNALLSTFAPNIEWQDGTPELTVTGRYAFAFSTLDGATVQGKQTYPTVYPKSSYPFIIAASGSYQTFNIMANYTWAGNNVTNPLPLSSPIVHEYTLIQFRLGGWGITNRMNRIYAGCDYYGYSTIDRTAPYLSKEWNGQGYNYGPHYAWVPITVMVKDTYHYSTGSRNDMAKWISLLYSRDEGQGADEVYIMDPKYRRANELEIKAFNAGWRP